MQNVYRNGVTTGHFRTGGFAGYVDQYYIIESAEADIQINGNNNDIGGLVGGSNHNSFSYVSIHGTLSAINISAGIVGSAEYTILSHCTCDVAISTSGSSN